MDRVLANAQWFNLFPTTKVYNLEGSPSDHCPLLVIPEMLSKGVKRNKFHFENAWLLDPMCFQIVKDYWEGQEEVSIMQKIKYFAENLENWGHEITGCFQKCIKECKSMLKLLRNRRDNQSMQDYEMTKKQLFLILDQKEIFWRQHSKQFWLQAGEKNTKYFHASCNGRKRINHIQRLTNDDGEWVDWDGGLQDLIKNYYQQLFYAGASQGEEVIACVSTTITKDHNRLLLEPVNEIEVRQGVFNMHPNKAQRPDGMTPAFFQKNWSVVGNEVVRMVRVFFATVF